VRERKHANSNARVKNILVEYAMPPSLGEKKKRDKKGLVGRSGRGKISHTGGETPSRRGEGGNLASLRMFGREQNGQGKKKKRVREFW